MDCTLHRDVPTYPVLLLTPNSEREPSLSLRPPIGRWAQSAECGTSGPQILQISQKVVLDDPDSILPLYQCTVRDPSLYTSALQEILSVAAQIGAEK